jgi:hypothetical protein
MSLRRPSPIVLVLALACGLGAGPIFAASADAAKQQLTKPAWQGYQDYLAGQSDARHGFFAISQDGQIWGQSGCSKGQCPADDALKASAIKRCEQFSAGVACLIFAEDRTILVPYEVKDYTQFGK